MSVHRTSWTRREVLRVLSASGLGAAAPSWLAACGSGAGRTSPPAITVGQDVCEWCKMTIDDARLAAAFMPAKGRALRFGEAGCLLAWLAGQGGPAGVSFVAAREDGEWLVAATARYDRGRIRTPMRFDLTAWREDPAGAGEYLTWAQLLEEGRPNARRS